MPSALNLRKPLLRYLFISFIAVIYCSCKFDDGIHNKTSFKDVSGIYYTEVRRSFDTGLAFNRYGYQLEPVWRIMFFSDTMANVYDPAKKIFQKFSVTLDHDSIFNVSGTWLKAIKVTKDSLTIQVLKVEGKTVYWVKSNVYMTFYADNYIKNRLHTDAGQLKKPLPRDTLFIKKRIATVDANPDSSFSGRVPPLITSNSARVTVEKEKVEADIMNKFDTSDAYMYPEYNITIDKAYENFSYSFLVTVDTQGQLYFKYSLDYIMPEFKVSTIKTIKGIVDGYLKTYLQVTPGSTLGMRHNCFVTLNVSGRKN